MRMQVVVERSALQQACALALDSLALVASY
jgi:hypothetical protein